MEQFEMFIKVSQQYYKRHFPMVSGDVCVCVCGRDTLKKLMNVCKTNVFNLINP